MKITYDRTKSVAVTSPPPLSPPVSPSSNCSHSFLSSFCRPIVCLCQSCQPHPQLTGAAAFVCCNRSVINTRLTVHFAWPESVQQQQQQRRLQHATRRLEKRENQPTNERTNCALSEMLKCIITVHFAHKHTHTPIHAPTLSHLDSLKLIFALRFSIYFFFLSLLLTWLAFCLP